MYSTVRVYAYCNLDDYVGLKSKNWKYVSIEHLTDYSKSPSTEQLKDDRRIYVSIGEDWKICKWLSTASADERCRWLHYKNVDDITEDHVYHCMLTATEPKYSAGDTDNEVPDDPLVTVYSSTYNSKDKITKPFQSLARQTYKKWEWIIVDDSTDTITWDNYLMKMQAALPGRVRVYDTDGISMDEYIKNSRTYSPKHCGLIGKMKGLAVSKGKGQILLELDHDDELTDDAIEKIVAAFLRNRSAGFVYGAFCEPHHGNSDCHVYPFGFAFGYGTEWKQYSKYLKTVVCPMIDGRLNAMTIRHLVGLPNHPRAWARSAYEKAGGYRSSLLVSDDYDLLVRTFLTSRFCEITDLLYYQYRYPQTQTVQTNVTVSRNEQIQILTSRLYRKFRDRIMERCVQLGLDLQVSTAPYTSILVTGDNDPRNQHCTLIDRPYQPNVVFYHISANCYGKLEIPKNYIEDDSTVIVMCIEDDTQQTKEKEVIELAKSLPDGKVRWRIADSRLSLDAEKKWAKYILAVDRIYCEVIL